MSDFVLISKRSRGLACAFFKEDRLVQYDSSPEKEREDRPFREGDVVVGRVREIREETASCYVDIGLSEPAFYPVEHPSSLQSIHPGEEALFIVRKLPFSQKPYTVTQNFSMIPEDRLRKLQGLVRHTPVGKRVYDAGSFLKSFLSPERISSVSEIHIEESVRSSCLAMLDEIEGPAEGLLDKILWRKESEDIFRVYGVYSEWERALRPKVFFSLPKGREGSLIIEKTQALTAIDVNSGNLRSREDKEQALLEVNLRAMREIARQIRLRNLGGQILIDMISLKEKAHRQDVADALAKALSEDTVYSKVHGITRMGLIEVSRKRSGKPLEETFI